jgi:hypothetical protein
MPLNLEYGIDQYAILRCRGDTNLEIVGGHAR